MKSYIKYLGLFDTNGTPHYVELKEGVNIITGRSSSGKSALIEIFDYCMGCEDNTIPVGCITANASLYFVVIYIYDKYLVLARKQSSKTKSFVRFVSKFELEDLKTDFFESDYYLANQNFKEEVGRILGISINDYTGEDYNYLDDKFIKKGRPSMRNMVSFMLQHQNLIANKHSLFYRFDQKEKKDKVIDEFKIFCGFVDEQYFCLKREIQKLMVQQKKLLKNKDFFSEQLENYAYNLGVLLNEYKNITGTDLFGETISSKYILSSPKQFLDIITPIDNIRIVQESNDYATEYDYLCQKRNVLLSQIRELNLKLTEINKSISNAEEYEKSVNSFMMKDDRFSNPKSICPFCGNEHSLNGHINDLIDGIEWLNSELRHTPIMVDTFYSSKKRVEADITKFKTELNVVNSSISKIKTINQELSNNKSLELQAIKVKCKGENLLEMYLESFCFNETELNTINIELEAKKTLLKTKYDIDNKIKSAERFINYSMKEIGDNLDFEDAYKPINLHFDIDTFELYHLMNNKKVYLRSMGSGANWLYSHICLFLSLMKYFCSLSEKCLIPSILFMDQPSQVYFPNKDEDNYFEPNKVDDLQSVSNLFDVICKYVKDSKKQYRFAPQIIITEHADNLNLQESDFNELVRHRWRGINDGLIDLSKL